MSGLTPRDRIDLSEASGAHEDHAEGEFSRRCSLCVMEESARMMKRSNEIVEEKGLTNLPVITQVIMSQDFEQAERAEARLRAGEHDWSEALVFVGSFARLDFALRMQEAGFATRDQLLDRLPDLWTGSDPDDTDPRFVRLWLEAWRRNDRRPVRDGRHLPKGRLLWVYRGQPKGAPIGLSWSLERKIAEKFANGAWARTADVGAREVITMEAMRSNVLAYLTGRGESEIILDPRLVERA